MKMATPTIESSPCSNFHSYPSLSPFSSKFLLTNSTYYQKTSSTPSSFPRLIFGSKNGARRTRAMASLGGLFGGMFKGIDTGENTRKQCASTVDLINRLEGEISRLSDSELRKRTGDLKDRAKKGESMDSLLTVQVIRSYRNTYIFAAEKLICRKGVETQAPGMMMEAERFLILSNIDRLWKDHLQALKFVQQGVGLRGYAQRDPLIEYKLEGYNLFLEMMTQFRLAKDQGNKK